MTVYVDADYRCHTQQDETGALTAVQTDFFDGKCKTFIEGYRLVPQGCSWTRADGVTLQGEMTAPWQDMQLLNAVQGAYEDALAAVRQLLPTEK